MQQLEEADIKQDRWTLFDDAELLLLDAIIRKAGDPLGMNQQTDAEIHRRWNYLKDDKKKYQVPAI
jgi:hypothetical protein